MIGCITKRAQIPFSSWLPAAMAAPTPVSSLVHSSTLVTAGIYVLYRFNFLLFDSFFYLSFISIFTITIAGIRALVELDFKKVVAISTLSQLGFMLFSLSIGLGLFCFLHIVFHAFFKRMLFLSTGRLIHLISGEQDSRNFGSLRDSFFSKSFFNCRCLRLIGIPFSLGFYRKDTILGVLSFGGISFSVILFIISCCFTVAYSVRLILINSFLFPSFMNSFRFSESFRFFFPVIILFLCCLFRGNFFMFYFLPVGIFSFFDFFIGLILVILGIFTFSIFSNNYFSYFFFIKIGFLSLLSTSFISVKNLFFSFFLDSS